MSGKNPENNVHYLPICMSIGISIGLAIGAGIDNIPIGMSIGLGLGMCVGGIIDAANRRKAEKSEKNSDDTGEAEG